MDGAAEEDLLMNWKLGASMLACLFTAAIAWTAHAGDACCAAAADKAGVEKPAGEASAPCQHAEGGGCADCGKCANCPNCASGKPCEQGKCEQCEHCANAAKGEKCDDCAGPGKCPHHENCQGDCKCAGPGEGSGAKPEGGEGK